MVRRHRRGEEGQVYPALLLAVIGGFALAVAFVSLQDLVDQTGRAASASDAAALAVGREHRDNVLDVFAGNQGLHLGQLASLLQGSGPAPAADQVAEQFASANGADLDGTVQYEGFDPGRRRWVYRVTTEQQDEVKGGDSKARSKSTSRVEVTITGGLCNGLSGIEVGGDCINAAQYLKDCVAPKPEPEPTDEPGKPGDKPTPTPTPTPFQPQGYCQLNLAQLLQWKISLIN